MPQPVEMGAKLAKRDDDVNVLKEELDIDSHRVPVEELFRRFNTNPTTVRYHERYWVSQGSLLALCFPTRSHCLN